jgi:hypothetical protein
MNWVILSELVHLIGFESSKHRNQLDSGVLVISIDVDVGSSLIGNHYIGFCNKDVHNYLPERKLGEIEELAIPRLVRLFDDLEIPATFAIRGQLADTPTDIFELFKKCKVKHDIGAHGYSHRSFTSLSATEAEDELIKISKGMKKHNIEPKSFVFPKNRIAHLNLFEKYGYRSYRGRAGFKYDDLYIEKQGKLYNEHPSFFLGRNPSPLFLNKILDISAKRKLPCHLWFHPSDLGCNELSIETRIEKLFLPSLSYAKKKEKEGNLRFETMASVVDTLEE